MTPLIKQLIEASLEDELDAYLKQCKEEGLLNRRNGKSSKTVKTATGSFKLETSRDRASTFERQLIKKRQTILNESLYN